MRRLLALPLIQLPDNTAILAQMWGHIRTAWDDSFFPWVGDVYLYNEFDWSGQSPSSAVGQEEDEPVGVVPEHLLTLVSGHPARKEDLVGVVVPPCQDPVHLSWQVDSAENSSSTAASEQSRASDLSRRPSLHTAQEEELVGAVAPELPESNTPHNNHILNIKLLVGLSLTSFAASVAGLMLLVMMAGTAVFPVAIGLIALGGVVGIGASIYGFFAERKPASDAAPTDTPIMRADPYQEQFEIETAAANESTRVALALGGG